VDKVLELVSQKGAVGGGAQGDVNIDVDHVPLVAAGHSREGELVGGVEVAACVAPEVGVEDGDAGVGVDAGRPFATEVLAVTLG